MARENASLKAGALLKAFGHKILVNVNSREKGKVLVLLIDGTIPSLCSVLISSFYRSNIVSLKYYPNHFEKQVQLLSLRYMIPKIVSLKHCRASKQINTDVYSTTLIYGKDLKSINSKCI